MGRVARYAYLHARVSAMSRRLLSNEALEGLVEVPLGQEAPVFEALGFAARAEAGAPRSLEQPLISLLLQDFVVLVRALNGAPRDFLIYWAHRFELSNLKAVIRGKMTGQAPAAMREQLVDMGPFAALPLEELLRAEDVPELLRQLEGTPYGDIARQARVIFEERRDLFALDAALDRRYFAGLAKRAGDIERGEDGDLRRLMANIIDRINLVWLLRYRFAYGLSPAETYYLLIPAGYRLTSRDLIALSQLGTFEEVLRALPVRIGRLVGNAASASEVTHALEQEGWRTARRILDRGAFGLARVLAYLQLREKDLRQVRAIVRGKLLKMSPALIRSAAGLEAA